jgi:hypothetical protein
LKSYRFEQILIQPSDELVAPTLSPRETLETTASVSFRPFTPLTGELSFFSVRDLLPSSEVVQDPGTRSILEKERWGPGPLDLGWETNRSLRARIGFRPTLGSWLRTDFVLATDYASDRSAAMVERVPLGVDTLLFLQRNANGNRSTRMSVSVEPASLVPALGLGAGSAPEGDTLEGREEPVEAGAPQEEDAGLLARAIGALDAIRVSRQGGLTARYYRRPIDPGPGFQLGWGGDDDFRFVDGDTASILTGRTVWSAGTGIRLPLNLRLSGSYSNSRIDILHLRSDRKIRSRSWPDLRLGITQLPLPGRVAGFLPSLSLSSGYRENLVETTFGGLGLQRRVQEEQQVPFEVSARWWGEVTTMYRGSFTDGEGKDPTGITRNRRRSHTFTLSAVIAEPLVLGDRLDGPLRVSLGYQYTSDLDCRIPSGRSDCIPFVDYLNRSINLTLDTRITPLDVGLHLTHTNRRSFVGRHEGSTQFQLGIFGQFVIDSNPTPPPTPVTGGGG